ncbi:MAG: hypothetical protein AB7P04_07790 [Bacteriovoracia bacterium]
MSEGTRPVALPRSRVYLSNFCRAFSLSTGLLIVQSFFIDQIGSGRISDLYFIANIFIVVIFLVQAFKDSRAVFLSHALWVAAAIVSLAVLLVSGSTATALYFSGILILVADVTGGSAIALVVSAIASPVLFRTVFLRMMMYDMAGRVAGNLLGWYLSSQHWLSAGLVVSVGLGLVHFFVFSRMPWQAGAEGGANSSAQAGFREQLREARRFMLGNPLIRTALKVILWTHVVKMLVELTFYKTLDERYSGAESIGMSISQMSVLVVIVTLVFQNFFGNRLNHRWRLVTLLSVAPVGTLVLSSAAFIFTPFWWVMGLTVFFQIVNRAIQLPASRQCLVPIPSHLRGSILSFASLLMACSYILTNGFISMFRGNVSVPMLLAILIAASFYGLIGISDLDSHYFQNFWRFVRERVSGSGDIWREWLPVGAVRDARSLSEWLAAPAAIHRKLAFSGRVEEVYRHAMPGIEVVQAAISHLGNLKSADPARKGEALRLLWRLRPAWARKFLVEGSSDSRFFLEVESRLQAWGELHHLNYYERARIRHFLILWEPHGDETQDRVGKILEKILMFGRTDRLYVLDTLLKLKPGDREGLELLFVLWGSANRDIEEWLERAAYAELAEGSVARRGMDFLVRHHPAEVRDALLNLLPRLDRLSLTLLYLEESLIFDQGSVPIEEIQMLASTSSNAEALSHRDLIVGLHLEALKGSRNEAYWRKMLKPLRTAAPR